MWVWPRWSRGIVNRFAREAKLALNGVNDELMFVI